MRSIISTFTRKPWTPESTYREPNAEEPSVIDRLLQPDFPGRPQIQRQLLNAHVRTVDLDGSFEFQISSATRANVIHRIPVEADYEDDDGIPVQILFHVVGGFAKEVERWKGDGSTIRRWPNASLRVQVAGGHSDHSTSFTQRTDHATGVRIGDRAYRCADGSIYVGTYYPLDVN